jgi:hypothetical protein
MDEQINLQLIRNLEKFGLTENEEKNVSGLDVKNMNKIYWQNS